MSEFVSIISALDNEPPAVVQPDVEHWISATASVPTSVSWVASVTDNSGLVTTTFDYSPGDTYPLGSTTVTYTATDSVGLMTVHSFMVTVARGMKRLLKYVDDRFLPSATVM